MDNICAVVTHYAILIGTNAYQDKPVKCCVQDVQNIKRYLEVMLSAVHMEVFRATESADPGSSSPAEDPSVGCEYHNHLSRLVHWERWPESGL
jgi:hypothetical protein